MSQPHPVLECAFFSQYGAPGVLAWTDITEFMRDDKSGATTNRGRQEATQKFTTGTLTVPLDNRFGAFDDKNPSSPFYPNLLPMKALRTSMEYPGMPGLIPDPRFQSGLGGWGNAANCTLSAIAPTIPMQRGLIRMSQTGGLANPSFRGPPVLTGFTVGKTMACSIRLVHATVLATGTPYIGIAYYSNTAGTTLISQSATNGAVVNIATNEVRLSHYAVVPATTQSVRVYLGWTASSTQVTVADYSGAVLDQMVANTVPTFTTLITSYVDSWPKTWDVKDSVVTMSGSDGLKVMALGGMTTPAYVSYVKGAANPPSVYLRMHEEPLAGAPPVDVRFLDEFTGAAHAQVSYVVNTGPLFGADGCAITDPDTSWSAIGNSSQDLGACLLSAQLSPSGVGPWTFNFWFKWIRPSSMVAEHPAVGDQLLAFGYELPGTNSPSYLAIEWGPNGTVRGRIDQQSGSKFHTLPGTTVVGDGIWHMITLVSTGVFYNLYVDGLLTGSAGYVSGGASITATAGRMPGGSAATPGAWPPTMEGTGQYDELMLYRTVALSAAEVSNLFSNARNVYPQERSDQRVGKILDLITWSAANRNISTLGRRVDPVSVPFFEANPLQYLQKVEDSEGGLLFLAADGRLTFVDVSTLTSADQYVLSHSTWTPAGPLSYEKLDTEGGDKTLYTRAVMTREGGGKQIADIDKTEYGIRPLSKSVITASDEETLNLGYWYLDHYRSPVSHINAMVVNPLISETLFNEVMALEIGMRITITVFPPPGTSSYNYVAMIQGIRHDVKRGRWRTTFDLSDQWGIRYERIGDLIGAYPMGL